MNNKMTKEEAMDAVKKMNLAELTTNKLRSLLWDLGWVTSDGALGKYKGCFRLKSTYFYRCQGTSDDTMAERLRRLFGNKVVIVDQGDHWAAWPKTSYFWVQFRLIDTRTPHEVKQAELDAKRTCEVSTFEYEASHGKLPRGRGLWWFEAEGHQEGFQGTYAEARKKAIAHFMKLAEGSPCEHFVIRTLP